MPLDGSGNYHYPPGTPGVPDTTIESEAYNSFIDDLVNNDLNVARPITRGGTGGTDPTSALANLGGEKAQQVVGDYDTMVWLSGSFYSDNTTGRHAPVDGHRFVGVSITPDVVTQANVMLEAFDLDSTPVGNRYTRIKKDGVWGAWTSLTAFLDTTYVKKAGDVMSGMLTIVMPTPVFQFNKSAPGQTAWIASAMGGKQRWVVELGNQVAESDDPATGSAGSHFAIHRYRNDGAFLSTVLTINRSDGSLTIGHNAGIAGGLSVNNGVNISAGGLSVAGGATITGTINHVGDETQTGNHATIGNIAVSGSSGSLTVNARAGSRAWTLYDPDGAGLQLDLNGVGTVFNVRSNGNVGVGTTAPGVFVPAARTLSIMNAASNYGILEVGNLAAAAGGQGIGGIGFVAPNGIPSSWVNKAYGCILVNSTGGGGANGFAGSMLFYLKGDNVANWGPGGTPMLSLDPTAGFGKSTFVGDLMCYRAPNPNIGLIYLGTSGHFIYADGTNLRYYNGTDNSVWHSGNLNLNGFVQYNRLVFVGDTTAIAGHNEPDGAYLIGGLNVGGPGGGVNAFRWKVVQYYIGASGWVTATQ